MLGDEEKSAENVSAWPEQLLLRRSRPVPLRPGRCRPPAQPSCSTPLLPRRSAPRILAQGCKESCSCDGGGTFSSCFEGTYYKYIFWIRTHIRLTLGPFWQRFLLEGQP